MIRFKAGPPRSVRRAVVLSSVLSIHAGAVVAASSWLALYAGGAAMVLPVIGGIVAASAAAVLLLWMIVIAGTSEKEDVVVSNREVVHEVERVLSIFPPAEQVVLRRLLRLGETSPRPLTVAIVFAMLNHLMTQTATVPLPAPTKAIPARETPR